MSLSGRTPQREPDPNRYLFEADSSGGLTPDDISRGRADPLALCCPCGRRRSWLQMDDTTPTSDAPAGFLPVIMPVLVDGEIYEVNYEFPIIPDDDRRRLDEIWRQREDLDMVFYGLNRKRARAPASGDDAIQRLLREARAGDAGMPEECAVCLQDFDANAKETLRVMPSCSHAFHPDCIFSWLRVKAVCPLCRCALPTQQHKDQDFEDDDHSDDSDDSDEDDSDEDEDAAANHQEESTPAVPDPEES